MNVPNGNRRMFYICIRCNAPATSTLPLQRCSGCQLVAYCSRDCQKDDREAHKLLCEAFPVVDGFNALHTTKSWEEHLDYLDTQLYLRLPAHYVDSYVAENRIFIDPKVCYTCRESHPDRLTMCKCSCLCYCSKKCTRADKVHKRFCSEIKNMTDEYCELFMRGSYPRTLEYALDLLSNEYRPSHDYCGVENWDELKVHIVINSTYFDAKAWELLFHQPKHWKLKHLKLDFIIQDTTFNLSFNRNEKITQQDCEYHRSVKHEHLITSSVHQKPYHMFFSSSEYSEPDAVIVYGITDTIKLPHSDISIRNMNYNQESVLVLTDTTEKLLVEGAQAVNAAGPIDELVPPIVNKQRSFGRHQTKTGYDASGINERYYLTCLRRK